MLHTNIIYTHTYQRFSKVNILHLNIYTPYLSLVHRNVNLK